MHSNISFRTPVAVIPDLPPSSFDYDAGDFAQQHLEPVDNLPEVAAAAPVTRTPIAIARAKTGATEMRLLRQSADGQDDVFLLETAVLQPYHAVRKELVTEGDSPKPMNQIEAISAYSKAVAERYPNEVLRSGKSIAIYEKLL